MTEPTGEAVATEATEAEPTATTARRGRPRPETTITRDEGVLEKLTGPMTRAQLIEATGLAQNQVYLSLYRLRVAGKVSRERQGANHVWTRTDAA